MIHCERADGVCLLRLAAPPLNMLTLPLLSALSNAFRHALEDADVRGIVLAGTSEHFSAGVDLAILQEAHTPEQALSVSRDFQQAFAAIEDSRKPVVAALAGRVMGGALELAMACHARVAAAASRFSMPEITLGIMPGAGGTQRLPRLVGPAVALNMLLTAESIGAEDALRAGLVDEVCAPQTLLDRAVHLARAAGAPCRTATRLDKISDRNAVALALAEAERGAAAARPELLAPSQIVEAVRTGIEQSFDAGILRERQGLAACLLTRAARNKIHLFFASRRAGKAPELAGVVPRPIARAAVVGMGTMGTGIALALLAAGLPVTAYDADPAARKRGGEKIREAVARRLQRSGGKAAGASLSLADSWEALADADLVIEAVFEDPAAKRLVFQRLESVCQPQAILASNTSTISLDELAAELRFPERLVGLHFFNPAHRMPLVEVIRPSQASPVTIATALGLARTLGKTAVLVKNRAGFLVSRLFVPYLKEAFWLLEEGAPAEAIDRTMVDFGFPMGPLALIDMAGLDILAHTDRVLDRAGLGAGDSPASVNALVARGQLGQKTGAGVYRYEGGDRTPRSNPPTEQLLGEIRGTRGLAPRKIDSDEIAQRLVLSMVNEAFAILEDGIAQRPSDLDVAVVLGIGFPDFRGGVVRYAEDLGLDRVAGELEELASRCGERFAPRPLLCHKGI